MQNKVSMALLGVARNYDPIIFNKKLKEFEAAL